MATSVYRRVLAGGVTILVLAGCGGPPEGVDRDLVGDWAAMPQLERMVPEVGACLDNGYHENVGLRLYDRPVDCSEPHVLETIHVGSFDEDEIVDKNEAPDPGTDLWRSAYQECDLADDEYFGADFRHGDLWLAVGVPSDQVWEAGARWFRCDAGERQTYFQSPLWPDTLRGSLGDEATLRPGLVLTCFTVAVEEAEGQLTAIELTELVRCAEPHDAEFVGVWRSDQARYPDGDRDWATVHGGCLDLVADYIDVPSSDAVWALRISTIVQGMGPDGWDNGDRGFRCFLHVYDDQVDRSLEGAGVDALRSS